MNWLKKQLGNLSLKMTAFVIGVIVIIFGISGFVELRMAYQTASADAHQRADDAMTSSANAVDWRLYNVETTTKTAGGFAKILEKDPESSYTFLKNIIDSNPDIAAAGLLFKPGYFPGKKEGFAPTVERNVYSNELSVADISTPQYGFRYYEGDANWNAALKGESLWGTPYVDTTFSRRPLVPFSIPLYDSKGDFMAALYTEIDLHWLWLLLNDLKPTPESQISAIDANGVFLCHPDSNMVLSTNALELAKSSNDTTVLAITKKMLNGERGMDSLINGAQTEVSDNTNVVTDNIEASYVYYAPIKRTGWSITFTYPSKKVLSIPKAMFANMIKLGSITIILLIIVIALGIHLIARPFAERLQTVTASKAGIESELKVASGIQMGMIPKLYPAFPFRSELDVCGFIKPAKSVGGDLYDYFIRDDKFYFCIGDVSGKGVPASLFMAVIRALFRNVALHSDDPSVVADALNGALADGNDLNMFCTMFIGVLDLTNGHLDYCNAGHNAPIIRRIVDGNVQVDYMKVETNLAIGVFEGFPFQKEETVLAPGEAIFLYTDGVTEAESVDKQLFGEEATLKALADARAHNIRTSQDFINAVYQTISQHTHDAEQSDDITMCVVEYKGTENADKA